MRRLPKCGARSKSTRLRTFAELTSHSTRPEFQYRHNWDENDLVMWDDCSTQHKATFEYALPLRRRMHRTAVMNGL